MLMYFGSEKPWLGDSIKFYFTLHVENSETDHLQHDLYDCGHFIQIHSCMGICFSCMYTNNYEHFHKWFGSLYRDNSVLMRVPQIQESWVMITFTILLNCIINGIAICNFYFSVNDYVCTLLLAAYSPAVIHYHTVPISFWL